MTSSCHCELVTIDFVHIFRDIVTSGESSGKIANIKKLYANPVEIFDITSQSATNTCAYSTFLELNFSNHDQRQKVKIYTGFEW